MFSTHSQLKIRTPENGTDRESFLSLLVDEFLNSSSYDAKCQVLANLANFSYDPINFVYIRDVGVLDIFLHVIKTETKSKLITYSCSGICNLCNDPLNVEYILKNDGLKPIIALLKSKQSEILADAITILIYLNNNLTNAEIATDENIEIIKNLSMCDDKIISNLSYVFLQDVCNITLK